LGEKEMVKRTASQAMIILLFLTILTCAFTAFSICLVKASGPIYIRADGSIDPPTAPIHQNGDSYTLTANIDGSIVIEKDNIIVDGAGHTLQGTGSETGIDLSLRTNVTIQNMEIRTFDYAVYLSSSQYISILRTNVADSSDGIWVSGSSSNNICGNNITTNVLEGIYILSSTDNSISGNNITTNTFDGIYLFSSSNNTISGNNIVNNGDGITSYYSSDNSIFHNNFISNFEQAYVESSANVWDDAYPSGGNYWSDYAGVDKKCGPSQDHLGGDGIGDTSYTIDTENKDRYPLMNPWIPPYGHNIAVISVVPSKTVVGQGYSCNITVYGVNRGEYSETFNVTAYANTTSVASQNVTLSSGNSTTINFTWNTTGFAKGNYTISAYALPVQGETDTADNNLADGVVIVTILGDVDGNFKVDMGDVVLVLNAFGSKSGQPRYSANCDFDDNLKIDMGDVVTALDHFGQHYP
jgi:parallel beta-helix repeat protein